MKRPNKHFADNNHSAFREITLVDGPAQEARGVVWCCSATVNSKWSITATGNRVGVGWAYWTYMMFCVVDGVKFEGKAKSKRSATKYRAIKKRQTEDNQSGKRAFSSSTRFKEVDRIEQPSNLNLLLLQRGALALRKSRTNYIMLSQ